MAGKHYGNGGGVTALSLGTSPPFYPGGRLDRAYTEGRENGVLGNNPHVSGTPEFNVWGTGALNTANAAEQVQTAYE